MSIALILPFWRRQEATDKAMESLETHYGGTDLRVVVVDDGSPDPYIPKWTAVDVIYLPKKDGPLNPCVPYNQGVAATDDGFIALSNPENIHRTPILDAMRRAITDENTYVMAACWCPEQGRWHCHSNMNRRNNNDVGAYLPAGANYHFMSMMHRSLWNRIGGFDEDYRQGAGYDDPDLVRRLHRAGAEFVMLDDLVVDHQRSNAHASWTTQMFRRNRAVFVSKWKPLELAAA